MSQFVLPSLTVFVPLVVATLVSYIMLIRQDPRSGSRH